MEDSPSKPSVAELAGRLKGHILPMPCTNDEVAFRRRPPRSLKLQHPKPDNEEADKSAVSPNPLKTRMKSSPIIEKLQANLALSPTALLPSPKSPEVKLQPAPLSPSPPCGPLTPSLQPSQLSTEEEDPVSFDSPPDGAPLQSINKTRARLSFKRRPPTRQHRRSAGEEAGAFGSSLSPSEVHSPEENRNQPQGIDNPAEEDEYRDLGSVKEEEEEDKDRDCEKTEHEEARSDPCDEGDPEKEQTSEQALSEEALGEEQLPSQPWPAGQTESDVTAEEAQEEMTQNAPHRGDDEV